MPDSKIDEDTNMRAKRTRSMNCTGQALVEMAIILPLLLLLVMGIFEFGRAMYLKNTLTHAARAGARTAVVTSGLVSPILGGLCSNSSVVIQSTCNSLYSGIDKSDARIDIEVFAPGVDPETGTAKTTTAASPPSPGDTVKVQVNINNFRSKYRIIPFIPLPVALSGTNSMRYE
jgi:Flp pilus assembly protein TadG